MDTPIRPRRPRVDAPAPPGQDGAAAAMRVVIVEQPDPNGDRWAAALSVLLDAPGPAREAGRSGLVGPSGGAESPPKRDGAQ